MIDIFYTHEETNSDDFIRKILSAYYNIPNAPICKSINGKPYIPGRKIHFNLTHSESLSGKARPAVLKKFTEREKGEIFSVPDFYTHWTARESYVKFYGETLAAWWRKVEYFGGKIWFCGEETDAHILQFELDGYVFSVCGDYTRVSLHKVGK